MLPHHSITLFKVFFKCRSISCMVCLGPHPLDKETVLLLSVDQAHITFMYGSKTFSCGSLGA